MSFDGSWLIKIATPLGTQEVVLDIVDRDGELSGSANGGDERAEFIDPVVEGNRIRWTQQVTKPMRMSIAMDLTRDGDTIAGSAKAGLFPSVKVTGARQT